LGLGTDLNAESNMPFVPNFRAADSLTSYGEIYGADAIVSSGVTTVYTAPKVWTWKSFAGLGCVFKLKDTFILDRLISDSAGMQIDLSFPEIKRMRSQRQDLPRTQMGLVSMVRKHLIRADNYRKAWQDYRKGVEGVIKPEKDYELEPLVLMLEGKIPARIECESEKEIRAALDIAGEFGLNVILERCMEAYKFSDELRERGIPCIVGPIREGLGWGKTLKAKFKTFQNPGLLAKAGVKIAIQTENFGNLLTYPRTLAIEAAYAVKYGLDKEEAMKAITINAAEILGVEDRIGSLEEDKDADLVIWSGHPFDMKSRVLMVIIDGDIVYQKKAR
jgi:imidazolonepropionase-like amidohydrolase